MWEGLIATVDARDSQSNSQFGPTSDLWTYLVLIEFLTSKPSDIHVEQMYLIMWVVSSYAGALSRQRWMARQS